jgi:hypothetical protein
MHDKPIYIYLGAASFSPWDARRKLLRASGKSDPVRSAREVCADRQFAEDEHLLRHSDNCDGDMISLDEPDEEAWEKLRRFIAAERLRQT